MGHGTAPIMAAFTHPSSSGSRFTDGSFDVYYCADSSDVAIAESAYHRARFLRGSDTGPCEVEMRLYQGELARPLHDGLGDQLPADVLTPDDYSDSQRWGGV